MPSPANSCGVAEDNPSAGAQAPSSPPLSTRAFLSQVWSLVGGLAGLLWLGASVCSLRAARPRPRFNLIDSATLDAVRGGATLRRGAVLIRPGAAGPELLSLRCPHLGCVLHREGVNFRCPCHRSRFGSDGRYLEGPAPHGLNKLELQKEGADFRPVGTGAHA